MADVRIGDLVVEYSELNWVVLRPSFIFGKESETIGFIKKYTTPYVPIRPEGRDEPTFEPLWVGDMAPITADALEDDKHVGKAYDLGGSDVLSFREVTRMLYRAEGKSVKIVSVPMELAKAGLWMIDPISAIPLGID